MKALLSIVVVMALLWLVFAPFRASRASAERSCTVALEQSLTGSDSLRALLMEPPVAQDFDQTCWGLLRFPERSR